MSLWVKLVHAATPKMTRARTRRIFEDKAFWRPACARHARQVKFGDVIETKLTFEQAKRDSPLAYDPKRARVWPCGYDASQWHFTAPTIDPSTFSWQPLWAPQVARWSRYSKA